MKLIIDKLSKIIRNKAKLEKILNVKITNNGKEVFIEGNPEEEFIAEKVLLALDFGFPFSHSITIKTQDCIFVTINIKDYTKSHNYERIRSRIIGKNGKVLKRLSELSDCFFELRYNEVGIIGLPDFIESAQKAVMDLARGAKHKNVYKFLETHKLEEPFDIELKDSFKN